MTTSNSRADLHRKMARVYDFCKGTAFEGKEYLIVKTDGVFTNISPLYLNLDPLRYTFPLGIVENKLVWEGDKLYLTEECGGQFAALIDYSHDLTKAGWSWNPPAPPKPKTVSVSVNGGEPITLDQMVDRFLGWRLPEHFHPDAGIVFTKPEKLYPLIEHPEHLWPTGTNLFDADQAKAMILYLLEGKM